MRVHIVRVRTIALQKYATRYAIDLAPLGATNA